jgi:hypothetical protein
LGEMAAIYEILPRMQSTSNPVLKRSLAIAVGDLLGQEGDMYRILAGEERLPGSEVEGMLDDLRHEIRAATHDRLGEQGRALIDMSHAIQKDYEAGRTTEVLERLFNLGIGLAALSYGIDYGGDKEVLIDVLIWRNPHFGLGMWYLDLLRANRAALSTGTPDKTHIQLGIYVLSRWRRQKIDASDTP